MRQPEPITAAPLISSGMRHGFLTRVGGVSEGAFDSLNCGFGSGDEVDRVARNRARGVEESTGRSLRLVTVRQTHTAIAHLVQQPWDPVDAPVGDALVTKSEDVALGILTADCAPVLMADATAGVVGAAHACWKGAFDGVVEATVALMVEQGADPARITAVVGPCIAQSSYEVGPEFVARFIAADADNAGFFRPSVRPGHGMFDLPGYVARRLTCAGIGSVGQTGGDTCAEGSRFYSYRRMTLEGGSAYGRGLSVIALG